MKVAIVGAGPAGIAAADVLTGHGIAVSVIDEGRVAGGQIYRRARAGLKLDVDALVTAIVDFCAMVSQLGRRLVEAEINPIFVLPQGTGVRAADAVAVLAAPALGLQHEEGAIRRQHGPTP